jgi:signal transduction histidine kinase/CheY-like chemotaxis protein
MSDDFHDTTVTRVRGIERDTREERPVGDRALLVVLVGADAGRTHVVEESVVLGRAPDVDVQIRGDDASRLHARIKRIEPGRFVIEDLRSKNGTRVNGVKVSEHTLRFGDKIRIGSQSILLFTGYDPLEDQLLHFQRLESLGQLAGGVAHDLNNVLSVLLMNLAFLKGLAGEVKLGERTVQECLQGIDTAATRAVEISRQLLGLARRDRREDVQLDVVRAVEAVTRLLARTFHRSIRIKTDVAQGLWVKGDPAQLNQVLMNLCINARDAMPDGGTLTLAGRMKALSAESADRVPLVRPGYYVELSVADTGHGMSEEVLKRAFEPFYTTKAKGQGTGLGLATVESIARQHGGHVEVTSEVGKGTTVCIYLPVVAAAEAQRRTVDVELGSGETRRLAQGAVLVVDDDEAFLASARRLLEGLGYAVLVAADGSEALRVYEQHQDLIELVLLDMVMPEMDGAAVFQALQQRNPSVRVLISSGVTELAGVRELLEAGAQGFLQKPYDAGALAEAVSKIMFGVPGGPGGA